ncbi:alpha/beta hydrolase [Bradyrhizobium brasilense]|uniref:alpha/beta fold hydrolase n=1 Tax=Bradyrhizobium brasilense TaxID=1419277 RepID=UPI0028775866|nr:alpha/beta hydrolase [Bradyrhizobium brasilense]MCP3417873.1 alpha/beta hydrolase [Bradyrhizobium brasilense]
MRDKLLVNGALHAYQEMGRIDAPPIIVIHGGRGASYFLDDFSSFEPLSDKFRVTSFERRGLGQSELKEPLTVDQLIEDVESFRKALFGAAPAAVIGVSFGAQLALLHALRYQDSVSGLVLIGGAACSDFEEMALDEFEKRAHLAPMATRDMIRRHLRGDLESDIEFRIIRFAISRLYDENYPVDVALKATLTDPCDVEVHRRYYMGSSFDVRNQLPALRVPTLIMCGENDWIAPLACSVEMHELIPGSKLHVIKDHGHTIYESAPEETRATIRAFLNS